MLRKDVFYVLSTMSNKNRQHSNSKDTETFEKMRIPDLNNNKLREKLFSPSRIIWIERISHVNILKVK